MDPKLTGGRGTPLRLLLQRYRKLSDEAVDHHARGLQFEEIINGLFAASDVEVERSFIGIPGLSRSTVPSSWTAGIIWSSVNGQQP